MTTEPTGDRRFFAADVDPTDPENDQTAVHYRDDLARHVDSARATLTQGPRSAALAVIAMALIDAEQDMPRDRLASLLAVAMVQLAEQGGP